MNAKLGISVLSLSVCAMALTAGTAAAEPVRIGVQLPLTGLSGTLGQHALRGIEFARDEINAAGGVLGEPLELIIEDTESQNQAAMDGIHKLIDVDGVPVVLGEISSARTIPTATYTTSQGAIHIGLASTSPDLRMIGDRFYNMVATDDVMGRAMVEAAIADTGGTKFGILVMNDPYGVGLANEMTKVIEEAGGTVVSEVRYELGKTDYRAELQRLFGPEPDVILSVSWGEIARLIQRQAWDLGMAQDMNEAWYSAYFFDSVVDCVPETCEGRKGVDIVPGDAERFAELQAAIRDRGGEEVTWYAAAGYDGIHVIANAIELAGSTDAAAIDAVMDEAFASTVGISSPDLSVDEDGIQQDQTFGLFIYRGGEILPYEIGSD